MWRDTYIPEQLKWVEHDFCKVEVIGSRPFSGSNGQLDEWLVPCLQNKSQEFESLTDLQGDKANLVKAHA